MSKKKHKKRMQQAMHQRREGQLVKKVKTAGHFSYLSKHAVKRLRQRTQMTAVELTHLLDNGGVLDIGKSPGLNRQSLLFYSPKDERCFVALRNDNIGKIITVWLLEYHKQLAWAVTEEQCEQAKQLYLNYQNQHEFLDKETVLPKVSKLPKEPKIENESSPTIHSGFIERPKPKKVLKYRFDNSELVSLQPQQAVATRMTFYISALYIDKQLQEKRKRLLKITTDIGEYHNDNCHLMLQNPELIGDIDAVIAQKRLQQGSIYALVIQDKKYECHKVIDLRDSYEAWLYVKAYQQKYQQMLDLLAKYHSNQPLLTWQSAIDKDANMNKAKITVVGMYQRLPKWLPNLIFAMILITLIYQMVKRLKPWSLLKSLQNR